MRLCRLNRRPYLHPKGLHGGRIARQIGVLSLESAMHGVIAKLLLDQSPLERDLLDALFDVFDFAAQLAQSTARPCAGIRAAFLSAIAGGVRRRLQRSLS